MTNPITDMSPRKAARVAGLGYLIIIILGIFAELFVRSKLIVPGDAATTANNIAASEWLFRIGIASDLIMLTFDVVVALALYVLLKPVHKSLALLAAWFRLVHATIYGITLLALFFVLQLLSGADYVTVFGADQLHALVLLFLNAHGTGYRIGLVFFGVHCVFLGYLVFKSGYLPRILGVLLICASLGYLIDSFANFLLPNYANYEAIFLLIVAVPAIIAELSLSLWLLLKGVNIQRMQ
jgi:hypothetical protein